MTRVLRSAYAILPLIGLVGVLVVLGRWERASNINSTAHWIETTRARVGPSLATRSLQSTTHAGGLTCLAYRVRAASALCFDAQGRLVEATRFGSSVNDTQSVVAYPAAAPVRTRVAELDALAHWATVRVALVLVQRSAGPGFRFWCMRSLHRGERAVLHRRPLSAHEATVLRDRCRVALPSVFETIRKPLPRVALGWTNRILRSYAVAAQAGAAALDILRKPITPARIAAFRRSDSRARALAALARRRDIATIEAQLRSLPGSA